MEIKDTTKIKNLIIFFDCHGEQIYKYLEQNKHIKLKYKINYLSFNRK